MNPETHGGPKISKELMLRRMVLYYEMGAGRPGVTLPRVVRHPRGYGGWTAAELDDLYLEMIQQDWAKSMLEPETPAGG